jgi:hypothetical protein
VAYEVDLSFFSLSIILWLLNSWIVAYGIILTKTRPNPVVGLFLIINSG